MFRKSLSLLLILACTLSMSACWDHLEISKMLIVAGIGLDLSDGGDVYQATVEVVNVQAEGDKNIASEIVEGTGDTMYDAIQNAMVMTGGTTFTNHCKVVVIGENLARQGINEILDLVLRSPNLRKTLEVLVAKDATAKEILTQKTVKSDIISYELEKILHSNADTLNITRATSVYHLHEAFISNCPSAVLPVVSTRKNNKDTVLYIEGVGVFWNAALQGYLSGAESNIYNIASQTVQDGTIAVSDKALSDHPIEAKILKSTVRYAPRMDGDRLSMLAEIQANVKLQGVSMLHVNLSDEHTVEQLENSLAKGLETDVQKLINHIQSDYGADILDFNKVFEDQYRQEWGFLSQDWQSHFREMQVVVTADVSIVGSGMIGNYAPKGEQANALP